MKLSKHFTLEEFIFSQTAARMGIDNSPSPKEIAELKKTAAQMEEVRLVCGSRPTFVSSGFRCLKLNRALGSSDFSAHTKWQAIDFKVSGLTVQQTINLIKKSDIKYDQLINEYGRWVHISFDPRYRMQSFRIG